MRFRKERGIAVCGLACVLCSVEECNGCRNCETNSTCEIYQCAKNKNYNGCYECEEYPCSKKRYGGIRTDAFLNYAKENGVEQLIEHLHKNMKQGIIYHYKNKSVGDYDQFDNQDDIKKFLIYGSGRDPYKECPQLETANFRLRLVKIEDADDLLACYSDKLAQPFFNSDNCIGDFCLTTKREVENMIIFWLREYQNKAFIRFSIVDKKLDKVIGTIEAFGHKNSVGVLRVDVISAYEKRKYLTELFSLVKSDLFYLFDTDCFVTKAVSSAGERRDALNRNSFDVYERKDYYVLYRGA